MNGEGTERQLDRLEEHILRIEEKLEAKIDKLHDKVEKINLHGCAKRDDDDRRINDLQSRVEVNTSWIKKGIAGLVGLLVAVIILMFRHVMSLSVSAF